MKCLITILILFVSLSVNSAIKTSNATGRWGTPSTWVGNVVPASTDTVIIASPHNVTLSSNFSCARLIINQGGTLTLGQKNLTINGELIVNGSFKETNQAGTDLFNGDVVINGTWSVTSDNIIIGGNFTYNGSIFTPGTGNYTFNGTIKTMSGSSISGINVIINGSYTYDFTNTCTFSTLTINSTKSLTIKAPRCLTISGAVSNAGTFLVDGSPNGISASLITNGTITNTGTMSFKTSISKLKWHCISSPVSNAQIETVFSDLSLNNNNFYSYVETQATYSNYWLQQITGLMPVMKGYYLYYFANKYKTYSGTFNTGNQSISNLTYTTTGRQGWNLVGNPYPSSIDWLATGWTKTNLEDAIYVKNGSVWEYYVGGIGTGSRYIYPGQGFFVKTLPNTTGSLAMTNTVRVHRPTDYLKSVTQDTIIYDEVIKLKIANDSLRSFAFIRYNLNATKDFDPTLDAKLMKSENTNIPLIYSVGELCVNSRPLRTEGDTVYLQIETIPGNYTIYFDELNNIKTSTELFFVDFSTGQEVAMTVGGSFTFSTLNKVTHNFAIKVKDQISLPITLINFTATLLNHEVSLKWSTSSEINNDYFIVEKSTDSEHFVDIKTIDGAGNSNTIINYETIDYTSNGCYIYYRLKQVDYDGKFTYSGIAAVCINVEECDGDVIDLSGRIITKFNTNQKLELKQGLYLLRIGNKITKIVF